MRRLALIILGTVLVTACAGTPASLTPSTGAATPTIEPVAAWAEDLALLDAAVRKYHPDPFAINPESAWTAKLSELGTTLPDATPDQQVVQVASLVGLLDTHSGLDPRDLHAYGALFYPFADGWFTIRATDPKLVGTRLVSIGGMPMTEVEALLRPLVPADNESGELDGLEGLVSYVEYLHGAGIVEDVAHPQYRLARADGATVDVDLPTMDLASWEGVLGIVGGLVGEVPTAVFRRTIPVWTHLDPGTKTFLLSFNDYEEVELPKAVGDVLKAVDTGAAERVVVDMRYLRGGNGSLAGPLISGLGLDKRFDQPGILTVLIGRENVSAGTIVAGALDRDTGALMVGEPTPARADNFLCQCHTIILPNSGFVIEIPTVFLDNGDPRPAVMPDVPMSLSSMDFFAGQDPVLAAALAGDLP